MAKFVVEIIPCSDMIGAPSLGQDRGYTKIPTAIDGSEPTNTNAFPNCRYSVRTLSILKPTLDY